MLQRDGEPPPRHKDTKKYTKLTLWPSDFVADPGLSFKGLNLGTGNCHRHKGTKKYIKLSLCLGDFVADPGLNLLNLQKGYFLPCRAIKSYDRL